MTTSPSTPMRPTRSRSTRSPLPGARRRPRATRRSRTTRTWSIPTTSRPTSTRSCKDRIAAADDDEDEDEVEVVDPRAPETPDGVTPKKANEFVCTGCFLLVNRGQFGPADNMVCPVGEADCPAITKLRKAKK